MSKNMKTEKCVICKKAKDDVGHYGDTGIYVCLKCYKGNKFRMYLDKRGVK